MIFIIAILTLYCFLLLVLQVGWHKAVRERENNNSVAYPMISVIVPVRNEQENIARTLIALKNQTYGNFEVIVVNDQSSDRTVAIAMQNAFRGVSIIDNRGAGKKAALQTGIDVAKGDLIATTDGDCEMNEHWLESIHKTFSNEKVMLAFGAVGIESKSFFSKVQAVEFASLIGSGAATSALGFPTMCNGANLAFRKTAFTTVRGYDGNQHISSGDDEFLMRKMHSHFPNGIKFIPYKVASVITSPKKTLSEFVSQRLRWAGKWKHNTALSTVALALFVFGSQLSVITGLITLLTSFNYSIALLLLIKFAFEATFINRVCRFSNTRFSWPAFLLLQIVYPLYVIVIGMLSNFVKPSWKNRRIES